MAHGSAQHDPWWLWVPAFAGTTAACLRLRSASPESQALTSTPIRRIKQLEPRPALELVLRVLASRLIDLALPRLAQETGLDHQVALGRHLLAALLEENAAHRRFARRRREIG